MKHTITEIVKDNNIAHLQYLRQGIAYYTVSVFEKTVVYSYTFQVPLIDIGLATLNVKEKALLMMRYIRKAIEDNTLTSTELEYD